MEAHPLRMRQRIIELYELGRQTGEIAEALGTVPLGHAARPFSTASYSSQPGRRRRPRRGLGRGLQCSSGCSWHSFRETWVAEEVEPAIFGAHGRSGVASPSKWSP